MKRLVVGISGASGAIYGIRLLNRALDQLDIDLDADLFVRWNAPPQPNSLKETLTEKLLQIGAN